MGQLYQLIPAEAWSDHNVEDEAEKASRSTDEDMQHKLDLIRRAFYEGLSHSEIAEATGLALGTVKSRLHRAKAALVIVTT